MIRPSMNHQDTKVTKKTHPCFKTRSSPWCPSCLGGSTVLAILLLALVFTTFAQAAQPSFADFDRRARAGEHLNVVFFGASLTWGANATDPMRTSYRAQTADRLEKRYPQAHFKFFDAAIGGTSSQLGLFRLDRDVLARHPDLVFLDFTANDGVYEARPDTMASYEAIVRRIITEAHAPVVQVIFPFKWDVAAGKLDGMARREAHIAISIAYHTALGDAIALAQQRVRDKLTTLEELWPYDGVHPGDDGYTLFTDAAWSALLSAIDDQRVCAPPEKMLNADTYMTSARIPLKDPPGPPAGWTVGKPHVVSAYFDMLMSRWLDSLVIATGPAAANYTLRFRGSDVLIFGEATVKSGSFTATIDGQPVQRPDGPKGAMIDTFDAGKLAKRLNGNTHFYQVLAENLDPDATHTLVIEPHLDTPDAELRFESICIAGPHAALVPASPN